MKVGIVGGQGGMGRLFCKLFSSQAVECLISDVNTELSNVELAKLVDVVLVSVPISETSRVLEDLRPALREDQMICDLTSLKAEPVKLMLRSKAEVLGLHPMFGPGLKDISGQLIIACRARPRVHTDIFLAVLERAGLKVKSQEPDEHDRLMAVIQGLNHLHALALANTAAETGCDLKKALEFGTPTFKIRTHLLSRLVSESPELYADILLGNPEAPALFEKYLESSRKLFDILKKRDRKRLIEYFKHAGEPFKEIKEEGFELSSRLIEYLAQLKF